MTSAKGRTANVEGGRVMTRMSSWVIATELDFVYQITAIEDSYSLFT